MRGHLREKPECQRLEASLLPITGEVERLPSVLGSLGRTPGQEIDLSKLTEAGGTHLSQRDSFDKLTEVAQGQRQPGTRSDEDRDWAQSQPHHPKPFQRLPDHASVLWLRLEPVEGRKPFLAGLSFLPSPGVMSSARI